jgi:transcriptional regulator with XRE-family HTH domain
MTAFERLGPLPQRLDGESFGTFLIRARLTTKGVKRAVMSQQDVADLLGVSGALIGRWERDEGLPSDEHVDALAPLFGLSVKQLQAMLAADRADAELAEAEAKVERLRREVITARANAKREAR